MCVVKRVVNDILENVAKGRRQLRYEDPSYGFCVSSQGSWAGDVQQCWEIGAVKKWGLVEGRYVIVGVILERD